MTFLFFPVFFQTDFFIFSCLQAAYRENTIGLPRLCPPESIDKIDRNTLFSFLSQHFTAKRIVVAGVGVDHDALIESTEKHFSNTKATWEEDTSLILPTAAKVGRDSSIAQYTGGDLRVEKDLSSASLGPSTIPELAHFALGFQSCSYSDDDFIAYCVLNIMMGGGGSFSAGGPGKGMHTRLYTHALNVEHWLYSATAYNHSYGDTGLFCIQASAGPEDADKMAALIVRMFQDMTGPVEEVGGLTGLPLMVLFHSLIDCSFDWLIEPLFVIDKSIDWLTDWLDCFACVIRWLIGWLDNCFFAETIQCLIGWLDCCSLFE